MKQEVKVYEVLNNLDCRKTVLCGTASDISTFIKNQWQTRKDEILEVSEGSIVVEEDYYLAVDKEMYIWMAVLGYTAKEICVVPIEDFQD